MDYGAQQEPMEADAPSCQSRRFDGVALGAALLVSAVLGFAAFAKAISPNPRDLIFGDVPAVRARFARDVAIRTDAAIDLFGQSLTDRFQKVFDVGVDVRRLQALGSEVSGI